jgi:hypothetical protein
MAMKPDTTGGVMFVTDELIALAKDSPLFAVKNLHEKMLSRLSQVQKEGEFYNRIGYDDLIDAYIFLETISEAGLLFQGNKTPGKIELTGNRDYDANKINEWLRIFFKRVNAEIEIMRAEELRSRLRLEVGSVFSYEFSQGDLSRVQELINGLRNELMACNGLEDEHRQRLMRRLETLQTELHKKVSNLDRFWGLIGDAGVILGKLGQDAKPLVDRIREITAIVWQTQARAEELPSGLPPPLLDKETSKDQ